MEHKLRLDEGRQRQSQTWPTITAGQVLI